jgi:predicted nucleotidyltransferase
MKQTEIKEKVKQIALSFDKEAKVYLFGSRARGKYKPDSDWDFLILLNKPLNKDLKEKIREKYYYAELETDQVISTLIHNSDHWEQLKVTPLYQIIKSEGIDI